MSLTLNSIRKSAYTSLVGRAPALLIGASKLILFHLLGRSSFSTVAQQNAQKAVTLPQNFLARQMRQRHHTRQISVGSVYARRSPATRSAAQFRRDQQMPRYLAVPTYRARQFDWSQLWQMFWEGFWAALFTFVYEEFCNRFVKTLGRS